MKRRILFVLALTATLMGTSAWAGPGGHHHDRAAHMERMTGELGLDDYQSEQVSVVLREQHEKFRALGRDLRDQGVARNSDEARAQRQAMHAETRARLSEVLTAEQLETFDEMHRDRMRHRHGKGKRSASEEL